MKTSGYAAESYEHQNTIEQARRRVMTKNVKKVIAITITVFAIYALLSVLNVVLEKQRERGSVPVEQRQREPDKLDAWIDKLILCESGGKETAIGDGGKARGVLQYHLPTFTYFVDRYNLLPNAEAAEIQNLWLDTEFQKELTRRVIEESRENAYHWANCTYKIGLPPTR